MNRLQFAITKNKLMTENAKRAMKFIEKKCAGVSCIPAKLDISLNDPALKLIEAVKSGRVNAAAISLEKLQEYILANKEAEKIITAALFGGNDNRYVLMTKRGRKKSADDLLVECHSTLSSNQLMKIFDGIECVGVKGGINTEIGRLVQEKCDGILLPSADVALLNLNKNIMLKYNYFDERKLVPQIGSGVTAIIFRKDYELADSLLEISDIYTTKRLELEYMLKQKLDTVYCDDEDVNYDCIYATIKRGIIYIYAYVEKRHDSRHFAVEGNYGNREKIILKIAEQIEEYLEY